MPKCVILLRGYFTRPVHTNKMRVFVFHTVSNTSVELASAVLKWFSADAVGMTTAAKLFTVNMKQSDFM